MSNISVTVVGDHIVGKQATINIRSDRTGKLLLRKSIKYLTEDAQMPQGFITTGSSESRSKGTEGVSHLIDLDDSISDIINAHGNVLHLYHNFSGASDDNINQVNNEYESVWDFSKKESFYESNCDSFPARTECWQCNASSNRELVDRLRTEKAFLSPNIGRALLKVDRAHFVRFQDFAYQDSPQKMGSGWSISAPHLHANALQVLAPRLLFGANCLDIGSGSGFIAAVMACLVQGTGDELNHESSHTTKGSGNSSTSSNTGVSEDNKVTVGSGGGNGGGCVVGVDIIQEAVDFAHTTMTKHYPHLHCDFICGDAWKTIESNHCLSNTFSTTVQKKVRNQMGRMTSCPQDEAATEADTSGWINHQLFDVIHVGAEANEFPFNLLSQLSPKGRMVVSVSGSLLCVDALVRKEIKTDHSEELSINIVEEDYGSIEKDNVNNGEKNPPKQESLSMDSCCDLLDNINGEKVIKSSVVQGRIVDYTVRVVYEGSGFSALHRSSPSST